MSLHFKRTNAAQEMAKAVLGQSVFGTSTLFLGSPRRTGKSTFLTEDLTPALHSLNALVLYVDLWKNQNQDPADLIAFTIASALAKAQGRVAKVAQAVGLTKVSIHGVEFSLSAVGKTPGATIADALAELHTKAGKPVVLIVDEAQHAIKSREGMIAMFSLKSARDTINKPGETNLGLVMSGSDRDKLLRLVHGNGAPFMGSQITELPLLDKNFTDFFAGHLASEKPKLVIDNDRLYKTFVRFNFQPEELRNAIDRIAGPFGAADGENFNDLLDEEASRYEQILFDNYATLYDGFTKLQRAVLVRILSNSKDGKLFTADALGEYTKAHGKKVEAGAARASVEKLRELDPPVVWKSARGEYAPEDSRMREWYENMKKTGNWPPIK